MLEDQVGVALQLKFNGLLSILLWQVIPMLPPLQIVG